MNIERKKILLWDSEGVLAIILERSGIVYTNQTGGHACCHPEEEGILIPFNNDYPLDSPEERLEYRLSNLLENAQYLTKKTADLVDSVLIDCRFENVRVDRSRLKESQEAWVYIEVNGELDFVDGFKNFKAVLTWNNSD